MDVTTIISIVVVVVSIVIAGIAGYLYIKNHTFDEIRADVYQMFLKAEHEYEHGDNQAKMDAVVAFAHSILPAWIAPFITDKSIRKVLQCWFTAVKDLLDDGKYNGSTIVKEE